MQLRMSYPTLYIEKWKNGCDTMYKDYNYANQRLINTIVRLNNIPVFIIAVNHDGSTLYYEVGGSGEHKSEHLDNFDLKPMPLGYVNYDGASTYLQRMPLRRDWRQGARAHNVNSSNLDFNTRTILNSRAFVKCVLNEYPTFKKCFHEVYEDGHRSSSFSREFALVRSGDADKCNVQYKGKRIVGEATLDGVVLAERFKYLQETLDEVI